jgi:hypothetical protein
MNTTMKRFLFAATVLLATAACDHTPTGIPISDGPSGQGWQPVGGGNPDTVLVDRGYDPTSAVTLPTATPSFVPR